MKNATSSPKKAKRPVNALLKWRIEHPIQKPDTFKEGDYCVLRKWDEDPTFDKNGQNPKIRKARANYPYEDREVRRMMEHPMRIERVEANWNTPSVYVDMWKYLGRKCGGSPDYGTRWLLISDVRKVNPPAKAPL